MKKCPPGVICIENVTMIFIFIAIFIIIYICYISFYDNKSKHGYRREQREQRERESQGKIEYVERPVISLLPSYPYNNLPPPVPGDVLLNPYVPPLRDERYLVPSLNMIPSGAVPINISTNVGAVDTSYRQVGILTPLNSSSKDSILPLMGRPLFVNRDNGSTIP